jgi:hypothetical protein
MQNDTISVIFLLILLQNSKHPASSGVFERFFNFAPGAWWGIRAHPEWNRCS